MSYDPIITDTTLEGSVGGAALLLSYGLAPLPAPPASYDPVILDTTLQGNIGGGALSMSCDLAPFSAPLASYNPVITNTTLQGSRGGGPLSMSCGLAPLSAPVGSAIPSPVSVEAGEDEHMVQDYWAISWLCHVASVANEPKVKMSIKLRYIPIKFLSGGESQDQQTAGQKMIRCYQIQGRTVIFLFEGGFGNVLHTGDCRLTPDCIEGLPLRCPLQFPAKEASIRQVIAFPRLSEQAVEMLALARAKQQPEPLIISLLRNAYVKKHCLLSRLGHNDPIWKLLRITDGNSTVTGSPQAVQPVVEAIKGSEEEGTSLADYTQNTKWPEGVGPSWGARFKVREVGKGDKIEAIEEALSEDCTVLIGNGNKSEGLGTDRPGTSLSNVLHAKVRNLYRSMNVPVPRALPSLVELM
ncbi:hypothetical protein BRADI_2g29950v3 [Brachypodium distachyon]|uniref:Uncharacterized protein n=1 Tax=Brachypodium distachyon TaxID=15368 RepID=I1HKG0_BRADI|nr:hypothetical protein BRADI_2g29950v3 [Brachypodium distachyon]